MVVKSIVGTFVYNSRKKISTKGYDEPRMNTNKLIDELLIGGCKIDCEGVVYE